MSQKLMWSLISQYVNRTFQRISNKNFLQKLEHDTKLTISYKKQKTHIFPKIIPFNRSRILISLLTSNIVQSNLKFTNSYPVWKFGGTKKSKTFLKKF